MIERLEVRGYRALRYTCVPITHFQVLVGANATGKSTFFDALLLMRDILAVGLERAVFGDSRTSIAPRVTDPQDLSWNRSADLIELAVTAAIPPPLVEKLKGRYRHVRYELGIDMGELSIKSETLGLLKGDRLRPYEAPAVLDDPFLPYEAETPDTILTPLDALKPPHARKTLVRYPDSGNTEFYSETSYWRGVFKGGSRKSALANLPDDDTKFPVSTWFKQLLMDGIYRLNLNPELMRLPCPAGLHGALLPDGSNLPWVVHELAGQHLDGMRRWISHVRTALEDVERIDTVERPEDRSRYLVLTYTNGLKVPSWLLSDGTLRLLALTILAYVRMRPALILIEEPENGMHPQAIETLIQSLSSVYDSQVFLTTHSPVLLSLMKPEQLLCFGRGSSGAAAIVPGAQHPRLSSWQAGLHPGDLFAMGVLG